MQQIILEDCVRLASDAYYPKVKFLHPEQKYTDRKNTPDKDGFYQDSFLKKEHGWTRVRDSKFNPHGFFAVFYVRAAMKNNPNADGVIAFRGSDDIYDFTYHDVKIANNQWPQVYKNAIDFYDDIRADHP